LGWAAYDFFTVVVVAVETVDFIASQKLIHGFGHEMLPLHLSPC
jgi:hypothetical protein